MASLHESLYFGFERILTAFFEVQTPLKIAVWNSFPKAEFHMKGVERQGQNRPFARLQKNMFEIKLVMHGYLMLLLNKLDRRAHSRSGLYQGSFPRMLWNL